MSTATILPSPRFVAFDANGEPLAGGFVYTYVPGGTTPKTTWQDPGEATPNANPIPLDADGSCLMYGDGSYQITTTDSLGNAVPTYSGLSADLSAIIGVSAAMQPVVSAATIQDADVLLGISTTMLPFIGSETVEDARQVLVGSLSAGATHPPTSRGDYDSITTAYTGDLSQVGWPFPYTISGTSTLGEPATGYLYTPECSPYFDYLLNESGWNQSLTGDDGRTAATCHFLKLFNAGQGDCMGYIVSGFVNSTLPGSTSWLANAAISAYNADFQAGANGVYLNPRETDVSDEGFDCAAITDVVNLNRTNATAALGEPWIGYRVQSIGSAPIDGGFSASGLMTVGLDLTTATFGFNQSAITLGPAQRMYFGATNTGGYPLGTNPTGGYVTYEAGVMTLNNAGAQIQLAAGPVVTVVGELIVNGGPCLPFQDNTNNLGGSLNRWAQLFAGTSTINTSDENEKQDIETIPDALLDAWDQLQPTAFRFRASVVRKGEGARIHTGYVAQQFAAALMAQNLVPARWSAWCSDMTKTGGEIQGLRYDELFTIADAAHRRRMSRIEARLSALEQSNSQK